MLPRPLPPSRPLLKKQAGTRCAMHTTQASPRVKMPRTLRLAEEDPEAPRKKIVFDSHHAIHCVGPGASYPSYLGHLTVLRITDLDVFYFQGGFVYFIDKPDFLNLLKSQSFDIFGTATDTPGTRLLTEMEVEFILGILAIVGPQACWMFLGTDLATFMASKRKKLPRWTAQIALLFLARMILKEYATILYQKLCGLHADVAWSSLLKLFRRMIPPSIDLPGFCWDITVLRSWSRGPSPGSRLFFHLSLRAWHLFSTLLLETKRTSKAGSRHEPKIVSVLWQMGGSGSPAVTFGRCSRPFARVVMKS
jgi:hypothetical protein